MYLFYAHRIRNVVQRNRLELESEATKAFLDIVDFSRRAHHDDIARVGFEHVDEILFQHTLQVVHRGCLYIALRQ